MKMSSVKLNKKKTKALMMMSMMRTKMMMRKRKKMEAVSWSLSYRLEMRGLTSETNRNLLVILNRIRRRRKWSWFHLLAYRGRPSISKHLPLLGNIPVNSILIS
jgi:hypothetical protein